MENNSNGSVVEIPGLSEEKKKRVEESAHLLANAAARTIDVLKMIVSLVTGANSKITIVIELGAGSLDPELPPAPIVVGEHLPSEVAKLASSLPDAGGKELQKNNPEITMHDTAKG